MIIRANTYIIMDFGPGEIYQFHVTICTQHHVPQTDVSAVGWQFWDF